MNEIKMRVVYGLVYDEVIIYKKSNFISIFNF